MRLNGLGNTFDENGNLIKPGHHHDGGRAVHGLGADDTRSIGAALWEFFNPGKVQEEYRAVGKDAPSYTDIWGNAFDDAMTAGAEGVYSVKEGAAKAADYGKDVLKLVAVIATGVAIVYVLDRFVPSKGHVKRYAVRRLSKARKRVEKAIA